ncbi:MAG: KH domain-containing protein [Parcubacteria group bacterium]
MAEEKNLDLEFVEYVVKALVDNPDKVKAERTIDEMGVLISLHVDSADMGQVIGRQGQTAKSIRTLLKVVGAKSNARVNLKIIEPEGSTRPSKPAATAAPAAVEEDATDVVEDLKL